MRSTAGARPELKLFTGQKHSFGQSNDWMHVSGGGCTVDPMVEQKCRFQAQISSSDFKLRFQALIFKHSS